MPQRRRCPGRKYRMPPADTMMKGMVDVSKMAMMGTVTIGTIGMVGSILKK